MEKFFNIAGPCNPTQHYMVPALERLPEVSRLVSRGQPWLVNAIGAKCVEDIHKFDYSKPITKADVEEAKEVIVRENPVHIDYLFEVIAKPGRARCPTAPRRRGDTPPYLMVGVSGRAAQDMPECGLTQPPSWTRVR